MDSQEPLRQNAVEYMPDANTGQGVTEELSGSRRACEFVPAAGEQYESGTGDHVSAWNRPSKRT